MRVLRSGRPIWANLAAEIRRVEPFSETFHLDVADGHYTPTMLFFPDLVAQLRQHTRLPFEVHLMTTDPLAWLDPFIEAGADGLFSATTRSKIPAAVLQGDPRERQTSRLVAADHRADRAGRAVLARSGPAVRRRHGDGDQGGLARCRRAGQDSRRPRNRSRSAGYQTEIEADGGIRRETVPLLAAAGADWIVPGSLMFKEEPAEMRRWLKTLTP